METRNRTRTVSIRMPEEMVAWLDARAAERGPTVLGESRGRIVRCCIAMAMVGHGQGAKDEPDDRDELARILRWSE